MAARSHPDSTIQAQKEAWYCKAKELYAETQHDPHQPLQIVQAAACIIFQALMSRDYSVAWLVMGKAWRQAVALGFHRLEGDRIRSPGQAPEPTSLVEKEEQRRTMWTLFILDRGMCFPVGLPHAIDDRQFMANLPLDTSVFQGIGSVPIESTTAKPFMRNFAKLLTSVQLDPNDPSPDLFHFIIVSYLLLGRIAEHLQAPYASTDPEEYESEFRSLEADLIRLRLSIPRCISSVPSGPTNTSKQAVWLNVMVNTSTILLHSRSKPRGTEAPINDQETRDDSGVADASQETKDLSEKKMQWSYCLAAAHSTVDIVKNASRVSLEILLNPHTPVAFYFAGRVLALEYVDTKSSGSSDSQQQQEKCQSLRTEIDFLLLLFDRITEVFHALGTKFKSGLLFDLGQDVETARRIKTEGIRAFLGNCRGWSSRATDYRRPS
ncbi:hypothetical protein FQN54_001215 [Arachnomyces sp. PD_36]|nr:hypothetical protein FQN54_001215 [Arachnomyces sp. PD_36]